MNIKSQKQDVYGLSKNRKGQAALEFLTTYGWAFLVILVMIGALSYFGVLNPTKFVPDSCTFASPFGCDDAVVNTTAVTLRIRNNAEALVITSLKVADVDNGETVGLINELTVISNACVDDGSNSCAGPSGCTGATSLTCESGAVMLIENTADITNPYVTGVKKRMKIDIAYYYAKSGSQFGKNTGGDIVGTVQ